MSSLLEAALGYRRRGWSVIPLQPRGKKPLLARWKEYQDTAAGAEEITEWWTAHPDANIGIITGSVSRLVVLDLDGSKAPQILRAHLDLPRTGAVRTAKGFHLYYTSSNADIGNATRLLAEGDSAVDVRGEGGYVVAPPSVHETGKVYQWVIPPEEIIPLPPEIEEFLLSRQGRCQTSTETDGAEWWGAVAAGVPRGKRNDAAARVAGYFARMTGGNREAVLRALALWNTHNPEPLPERELATVTASVCHREVVRVRAETSRAMPRVEVVSGARLAEELATSEPRTGLAVTTPGVAALGGLVPGELLVFAGRPGAGKTSLACQLCAEVALDKRISTLVVSTELSRRQWGWWTAAAAWCTDVGSLRPLPGPLLDAFRQAPLAVVDAGAPSIADVRAVAESTIGVRLIIVDHIGRLVGGRRETRTLEVGDVARGLKAMAKDLGATVVALCQLNRGIEAREDKRPRLSDLRDSGEVEQEADSVTFLFSTSRAEKGSGPRPVTMAMEKNRHGSLTDIKTLFHPAQHRFVVDHAP